MVEKLWNNILARNKIMEIAEEIAPQFKTRKADEQGNFARFISVKNIEFTVSYFEEIVQYDVQIEFLSDVGTWIQQILIREFTSIHLFETELQLTTALDQRLFTHNTVNPIQRLYHSDETLLIAYDQGEGTGIHQLSLDTALQDLQFGILAATLQGGDVVTHNYEELRGLAKYLIKSLPFQAKEIIRFRKWIKNQLDLLLNSEGGYEPLTVFARHVFRFTPLTEPVTESLIRQYKAFNIEIIPEQPSEQYSDRMEEVASYFAQDVLDEYLMTSSLDSVTERIKQFLNGYDTGLKRVMFRSLPQIYPNGLPLDLHIVIDIWILYYFQMQDDHPKTNYQLQDIEDFTNFMLNSQPLQFAYPGMESSRTVQPS